MNEGNDMKQQDFFTAGIKQYGMLSGLTCCLPRGFSKILVAQKTRVIIDCAYFLTSNFLYVCGNISIVGLSILVSVLLFHYFVTYFNNSSSFQ